MPRSLQEAIADAEHLADWFEAEGPSPENQAPVLDYYLELLADIHTAKEAALAEAVGLVRERGASWEQIAEVLDLTVSEAERRFNSTTLKGCPADRAQG